MSINLSVKNFYVKEIWLVDLDQNDEGTIVDDDSYDPLVANITISNNKRYTTKVIEELLLVNQPLIYDIIFGWLLKAKEKLTLVTFYMKEKFPTLMDVRYMESNNYF
ncbi:hypothetical protein J1N35_040319 [Gossypium stocksii]|uniref:Uncharacterized protein n=1 Tax=Gossypium stocksii TaxID=47602 RepID=A0A9D3ZI75_9ROSI|nr:hypothetical protein J1N35_040319 [Gossypium stocksii]